MITRRDSDESIFAAIKTRLEHARSEHPLGTDYMDIQGEYEEFLSAVVNEGTARAHDELLDVIVTCIRVIKGGDFRGVSV